MRRQHTVFLLILSLVKLSVTQDATEHAVNVTIPSSPLIQPPIVTPPLLQQDDPLSVICQPGDNACLVYSSGDSAPSGPGASGSILEWLLDQVFSVATLLAAIVNKLPQAAYSVVRREAGYEVRLYPESQWACSYTETNGFFWPGKDTAAMRSLFRYFSGKNSEGVRIPVAMPLLVRRDTTAHAPLGNRFYVCLPVTTDGGILPFDRQVAAPAPLSRAVSIQTLPHSHMLAATFGGQADKQEWDEEVQELIQNARNRAEPAVDFENHYLATYNLPHKLWGRRNEVWLRQEVPSPLTNGSLLTQPHVRYLTDHNHI